MNSPVAQHQSGNLCCTRIENFGVRINGMDILSDINLHIHCGELTALVGPNGAGKTTLMRSILGDTPHTGRLNFIDGKGLRTGRPVIGYVPQRLELDPGSPVTVLDLFSACTSRTPVFWPGSRQTGLKARKALERVRAEHIINRRLGVLSGGELQRVLLALALEPLPDLLLLDEPVSGVDQEGMAIFYDLVSDLRRRYDLSIILVSHDVDLVSYYADRIVHLNRSIRKIETPGHAAVPCASCEAAACPHSPGSGKRGL